jgi:hypothetical protein
MSLANLVVSVDGGLDVKWSKVNEIFCSCVIFRNIPSLSTPGLISDLVPDLD